MQAYFIDKNYVHREQYFKMQDRQIKIWKILVYDTGTLGKKYMYMISAFYLMQAYFINKNYVHGEQCFRMQDRQIKIWKFLV